MAGRFATLWNRTFRWRGSTNRGEIDVRYLSPGTCLGMYYRALGQPSRGPSTFVFVSVTQAFSLFHDGNRFNATCLRDSNPLLRLTRSYAYDEPVDRWGACGRQNPNNPARSAMTKRARGKREPLGTSIPARHVELQHSSISVPGVNRWPIGRYPEVYW